MIEAVEFSDGYQVPPLGPGQSFMSYLSPEHGDVRKIWNRNNPVEVEDARRSFNSLIDKGYRAFRVKDEKGKPGERMQTFDPDAEKMILIPQMAGG